MHVKSVSEVGGRGRKQAKYLANTAFAAQVGSGAERDFRERAGYSSAAEG